MRAGNRADHHADVFHRESRPKHRVNPEEKPMHSLRRTIACIGLTAVSSVVLAQSYPEKTVRGVVPYSAGGSADILARLVGKALGAHLGQSFVIANRGGAGGVIAHEMVAKAAPDGYTLLYSAAGPLTVSPHVYRKLSYDPLKTFVPVK